jgi:hypothetical protein
VRRKDTIIVFFFVVVGGGGGGGGGGGDMNYFGNDKSYMISGDRKTPTAESLTAIEEFNKLQIPRSTPSKCES